MSTTHAKTAAMGRLRWRGTSTTVAARIALTWLFTFPAAACWGFAWPASSVPPLLWYTDARYDFLTFDYRRLQPCTPYDTVVF